MRDRLRQIHWLVPASTVGSLIAGILFAIGHHLFYSSLDGTTPSLVMHNFAGSHISGQALNLAIGTTFAFLVRSCLAFAISLSYIQLAWYTIKRSSRDYTISDIDKVTSALSNLLVVLNIFAWTKWPILLLAALLSWLLPIATVITPATLTVGQISPLPEMRDVSSVAYTSANMFTVSTISSGDQYLRGQDQFYTASYDYQGPSDAVNLIAVTVGAQGGVLPLIPPAQNSTWNSTFYGPSIRCRNVSADLRNAINLDIAAFMNDSMFAHNLKEESTDSGLSNDALNPLYFAWTPSVPSDISPDDPSFEGYVRPLHRNPSRSYDISGRSTGDMAPLYVGVIPSAIKLTYPGKKGDLIVATRWDRNTTLPEVIEEYIDPGLTLLQCDLHNATYDVKYNFSAGLQTVETAISLLADEPFEVIDMAYGFTPKSDYKALIPAPEVGQELPAPADCQGLWNASSGANTTCAFDASVLEKFSYQAVWDAFMQLVRGGLYVDVTTYRPAELKDTSVTNTVLAGSTELAPIVELVRRRGNGSLQRDLVDRYSNVPGMYVTPSEESTQALSSMLEDLFRNITLSLTTSAELQPNKSSSYKPPQSQVTFTTISPVYEYAGHRLWLAYGLAIAISSLIVIAGLIVMYLGSAAYNSGFSTILRLGRGAHLSQEIIDRDHDGKEPLPEYLEKATISFAGAALWKQDSGGDAEYEIVSVQAPEPMITHDSLGVRADSHRPSTLRSSIGEYESHVSNDMSTYEPLRRPQGSESDARSPPPSLNEGTIGSSPRPGPDRVLHVSPGSSRI